MWLEQSLPLEKWVYAVKLDANGEEKHVTKGYSQISGIEYHETFSPTARITSLPVFIQLAMEKDPHCLSDGCKDHLPECNY